MKRWTDYRVSGTAALKPAATEGGRDSFVAFKGGRAVRGNEPGSGRGFRSAFVRVLASSEMFCSLLVESAAGCSFGVFTKGGIASLAIASLFVAAIALACGV